MSSTRKHSTLRRTWFAGLGGLLKVSLTGCEAGRPEERRPAAPVKQIGMVGCLLAGANLGQPFAEDGRKSGFDLGCDEAGFVQILEMRFVLGAKAGEFHPDQVRQGNQPNSPDRDSWGYLTNPTRTKRFLCPRQPDAEEWLLQGRIPTTLGTASQYRATAGARRAASGPSSALQCSSTP